MTFPPRPKWEEEYTEAEFKELLGDISQWPVLQETLEYSTGTLRYWARKFGFHYKRGRKSTRLMSVSDEDLREMYNQGWSMLRMAKAAGCDTASLRKHFKKMDITVPHSLWQRFYSEEELRRLLSLYPVGWEEVITRCNVNRRTVYRWCEKLGIPTPTNQ